MAKIKEKLKATQVKHLRKPGRYNDGGGLYFYVMSPDRRYWVFRYRDRTTGKLRDKGLGSYDDVTLQDARIKARACRTSLGANIDPIDSAKQDRLLAIAEKAKQITFRECAEKYIEAHQSSWRNQKHADQWSSTIGTYCLPILDLSVAEVDTAMVLKCLEPIWAAKTETATRVRQRIESILDWATVRKYRNGENPARWKGHLNKLLATPSRLKNVKHRPALDYRRIGSFVARLRQLEGLAARAVELQILTATRPGEVAGARWEEFDLKEGLWTIPAGRMKAHKQHEIPLTEQAIDLLKALPRSTDFVFPGVTSEKHLTTDAGMKCVKNLEPDITAHGFRSTFRDWAADCTNYPREVCEHALAHQLKDKAEAAYSRSSQLAKRKRLMNDWARFCNRKAISGTAVTPIRTQKP